MSKKDKIDLHKTYPLFSFRTFNQAYKDELELLVEAAVKSCNKSRPIPLKKNRVISSALKIGLELLKNDPKKYRE